MNITLNGAAHQTSAATIADLLQELQTPARGIAVACNQNVVRRAEHEATKLQEHDVIEIIRAVQGG